MGNNKFKRRHARGAGARDSGEDKKTTVAAATGPAGAMYKQGTAKDAANFDRTNEAMAEYVGVSLGPVASRAVRTLTKPTIKIGEKPERKYRSVAPAAVAGGLPIVTEVSNKYNADNSKNDPVVDAEDWRLTMSVFMKEYDNYMRDERQWKIDNGKIYNLVLQHCDQALKEELKTLDRWRRTEEDQDSVGILTMIRDSTHGLKQKKFGTMAIVECEYELDTTTQAPGDTIEWFHRVFLAQLATSRAHGGMPGYHPVLVEQHMELLMEAAGVTSSTAGTLTTTAELLDHAKAMTAMREKAVETSCEEYLACKFLLLSNGERYKPLRTHLENGHAEGKKPYPISVDSW
jgi:hypothetical protein